MGDFLKNFSLEGKIAWITGASYGLGLAYAVAFAESGAKIVFNDINPLDSSPDTISHPS